MCLRLERANIGQRKNRASTGMETLHSMSGFTSEASLSGNIPHTPPYTPHRTKRRLERSNSPASIKSIHPTETSSPAKKAAKRSTPDTVKVEELTESDLGYITDVDVVYPEELEEIGSDSDEDASISDSNESDDSIERHFSRLGCDESEEAEFERKRREKHLKKRTGSRVFKRSHSQSVKGDTEVTDSDAMGDQDHDGTARRLRRRVRGPSGVEVVFQDVAKSSPEHRALAPAAEILERRPKANDRLNEEDEKADAMDVDIST